jgi:hypothetical protein
MQLSCCYLDRLPWQIRLESCPFRSCLKFFFLSLKCYLQYLLIRSYLFSQTTADQFLSFIKLAGTTEYVSDLGLSLHIRDVRPQILAECFFKFAISISSSFDLNFTTFLLSVVQCGMKHFVSMVLPEYFFIMGY